MFQEVEVRWFLLRLLLGDTLFPEKGRQWLPFMMRRRIIVLIKNAHLKCFAANKYHLFKSRLKYPHACQYPPSVIVPRMTEPTVASVQPTVRFRVCCQLSDSRCPANSQFHGVHPSGSHRAANCQVQTVQPLSGSHRAANIRFTLCSQLSGSHRAANCQVHTVQPTVRFIPCSQLPGSHRAATVRFTPCSHFQIHTAQPTVRFTPCSHFQIHTVQPTVRFTPCSQLPGSQHAANC